MTANRRLVVSVWLAAVLFASVAGVALAASKTWELDSDSIMYKGTHTETGSVGIGVGRSNVWRAENAAQHDIPFSAETWDGTLKCASANSDKTFSVAVGVWNGTSFAAKGTSNGYSFGSAVVSYQVDVPAFDVPEGQWLALEIENTGGVNFTIVTDGSSSLTYSLDDPTYPVPELPTIVLVTIGLVSLAGYFALRRHRRGRLKV